MLNFIKMGVFFGCAILLFSAQLSKADCTDGECHAEPIVTPKECAQYVQDFSDLMDQYNALDDQLHSDPPPAPKVAAILKRKRDLISIKAKAASDKADSCMKKHAKKPDASPDGGTATATTTTDPDVTSSPPDAGLDSK